MMPLPGNPSWERNLRTRSRRTRQHSIVFVHFCTYVDGTCSFDQPKRNLENVKVRLCTAIFSISFALHTHTHTMNEYHEPSTFRTKNGQRMDKEWTKYNTLLSQNFCAAIVAMLWSEGLGHKAPVVHSADPLHLHPMELRQLGRALKSTIGQLHQHHWEEF